MAHVSRHPESKSVTRQVIDEHGRTWDLSVSRSGQDCEELIIICSDISEIVRMQQSLRRSERMSEMGSLLANVAHEVRNPLFGVSATLDAFEALHGAEKFHEFTGRLRVQVDRLTHLMNELLNYGVPRSTEKRQESPDEIMTAALSSMSELARRQSVTIDATISPMPPIQANAARLLQVFENLLKNAIEHSPQGSTIDFTSCVDGGYLQILVSDRGPGFRTEDLPRIFDPFFSRRRGGFGLGLALARRIAEEHGGTLEARNRDGGGATLELTLPYAAPRKE
jgi:signal transduction histidine kinase